MSLNPRITEVVDTLEHSHGSLVDAILALPADVRDAPAPDGRWSVAEHVEHLAIVEDGTGRLISKLIKGLADAGATEAADASDNETIASSMERYQVWTTNRPIVAPDFVRPRGTVSATDALAQLSTARARVVDAFRRASGLALGSITAPHPVLGPLTVYQWGVFLAQHEQRHLTQIHRLVAEIG
ncbi:MAG: DinB family protein [Gemmatimonadaceae bacterium]|nr:DinB family protein [Gemmatimonadaceae bacterium]